ncbi:hypothetical protein FRC14_004744 [Serendipita sp. 396]|nr:hypothetical protein FRC14_004744 [Serendipita sp. 396]KAG8824550.1 hypothetical protein FRC19_001574 [Serendipita sp. 401]KAG8851884.1 hypothetical protein FRB91_007300 [Serendipita sp. 411]
MSFFSSIKAKYDSRKAEKKAKRESKILSKEAKTDSSVAAAASSGQNQPEGEVHILPVPGPPQTGGGLNTNPDLEIRKGAGPVIPTAEMLAGIEQPKTREELRARAEELNR